MYFCNRAGKYLSLPDDDELQPAQQALLRGEAAEKREEAEKARRVELLNRREAEREAAQEAQRAADAARREAFEALQEEGSYRVWEARQEAWAAWRRGTGPKPSGHVFMAISVTGRATSASVALAHGVFCPRLPPAWPAMVMHSPARPPPDWGPVCRECQRNVSADAARVPP